MPTTVSATTTRDTTHYSYNGSGALISQVQSGLSESFRYDNVQGLVKKYSRYSGSGMFGTLQEWSYRYSASGEREQKRAVTVSGDVAKEWTYYLLGLGKQQLAVYEGLETTKSVCGVTDPYVYLWATEYLSYGLGDVHAITTKPTGTTTSEKAYKIEDHLGSTRVVISGSGVVVNTTDYEPFGGIASQSGTLPRKSYIDKETDAKSGLGDYGVRKYDDDLGIFRSTDALWEEYRGLSPYNYCGNNPVRLKDPSGFGDIEWWEVAKGATAAVVNDYSFGLIDFTKSSDHPHFKQGVEAGHVGVIVVSQMGAESAKGTAVAGHVVTVASGGTAAEVSEPIAWVATGSAVYLSGVSIYAMTQYMQSKATEVGGGEKKKEPEKITFIQGRGQDAKKVTVEIPEGYKKTNYYSEKQPVYYNGKNYISPDTYGHKGGVWKMAKKVDELKTRGQRIGTYNEKLQKVDD